MFNLKEQEKAKIKNMFDILVFLGFFAVTLLAISFKHLALAVLLAILSHFYVVMRS